MPKEQLEVNSSSKETEALKIEKKLYDYLHKRAGKDADTQYVSGLISGGIALGKEELDRALSHAFYFTSDHNAITEQEKRKNRYYGRIPEQERIAMTWATHKTNEMRIEAENKKGHYPRMPEYIEAFLEGAEDEKIQEQIKAAENTVGLADKIFNRLHREDIVSVDEVENELKEVISGLSEALKEIQQSKTRN